MTTTPEPGDTTATPSDSTPAEASASPPASSGPPASSAPPAPTSAPPAPSGGGLPISPVTLILCVLGAILVIVSIFLNWADLSVGRQTFTASGTDVPIQFLWDKNTTSNDPSLLIALLPGALLIALGALNKIRWFAIVGGLVAILVAVLYGYQVDQGLSDLPGKTGLFDFIGIAPWFALGGGIIGIIGGVMPRPSKA
jgi:hypothetical protein